MTAELVAAGTLWVDSGPSPEMERSCSRVTWPSVGTTRRSPFMVTGARRDWLSAGCACKTIESSALGCWATAMRSSPSTTNMALKKTWQLYSRRAGLGMTYSYANSDKP